MAGLGRFADTAARRRWSFFVWIGTCCFAAGGEERILLLTEYGLTAQLRSVGYTQPRRFRAMLEPWRE